MPKIFEPTRKAIKHSVTTLVVAVCVAAATPDSAEATPVYSTCYPGDELGAYNWAYDEYGNFSDFIEINDCALDRMGAGPEDRARVIEHELGHAEGYGHSEDTHHLMFPTMLITGY